MGKVDDNKKLKMNTLLQTAFDLFTGKGFAKTTVSDIVNQAGLSQGSVNNLRSAFYIALLIRILNTQQKISAFMLCDQISIQRCS